MFRRILLTGGIGGVLAGLLLSVVQAFQVVPIIQKAESYESATMVAGAQSSDPARAHRGPDTHAHNSEAWAPEDGLERTLWTAVANVGSAVGFGLLLAAAFSLRRRVTLPQGVLWGLAGFAVFFVAPALGIPPEIPGAEVAPLEGRQLWWLLTVACTSTGLGLLVFGKNMGLKGVGAMVLIVPHLMGAPQPDLHSGLAPEVLAEQFVLATAVANGVFWIALGALTAFLFRRLH